MSDEKRDESTWGQQVAESLGISFAWLVVELMTLAIASAVTANHFGLVYGVVFLLIGSAVFALWWVLTRG